MNVQILADILMACAGVIFVVSAAFQIYRTYRQQSADQFSWMFLWMMLIAIALFIIGKFLISCYIAALVDIISLIEYATLLWQKKRYSKKHTSLEFLSPQKQKGDL